MTAATHEAGPKYTVNIEGVDHSWDESTITTTQLRQLAGWEPHQQVVEVDLRSMTETTLADDAVVPLKPGQGFAKKIRFQRG
jgi:plastocyanin domain-containing protein